MINIVRSCLIRICILWPDNADIFYEKAMIIHNIPLSLPQYVEAELNKKKVIYLSKGNPAIQLEFIVAFYVFCDISFVNRCALNRCRPLFKFTRMTVLYIVHFL